MANIKFKTKPLESYTITSNYGYRIHPITGEKDLHAGIDLGANGGTPILAVDDGVVVKSVTNYGNTGYGNYITLQHNGYYTLYAHMQESPLYKEGSSVSAGSVIGYVGTTGSSTGNHLHLEVRVGSNSSSSAIDPRQLVDGSSYNYNGTPAPSTSTSNALMTGSKGSSDLPDSFVYTSIKPTYETTRDIDTQPFHAIIDMWIGNQHLPNIPPMYLLSLEHTETSGDGTGTIIVVLYDKYSDEVEKLILMYGRNVKIRYGNITGRYSRVLNTFISNYTINHTMEGNILTLNLVLQGAVDNMAPITAVLGESPSEAVKRICDREGWHYTHDSIEDAIQVYESGQVLKSFSLINDNPVDYIKTVIAPCSASKIDGRAGYHFYFDTTTTPETACFKPSRVDTDNLRTYVYQKGKNSPLLDFSVNVSVTAAGIGLPGGPDGSSFASTIEANGIDGDSKEEYHYSQDIHNKQTDATGDYIHTPPNNSKVLMDTKGLSYEEAKTTVNYSFNYAATQTLEASAVLIGDPSLKIHTNIRIIVLNHDNKMHHTSGIYYIHSLSNNISGGNMVTTLGLQKHGDIEGTVELSSYSSLYK